jgi:uncharacterized protein YjdB
MEGYVSNSATAGNVNVIYTCTRNFDYNGEVCQITFKVKEDATLGSTQLTIVTDGETYPIQDAINNKAVESTITNASVNVILPLESISLSSTENELWVGETAKVSVEYTPAETNQTGVTYESSNEDIAKVSEDGTVTAIGKGTATITATGANNKTATTSITVKQPITGITLDKTAIDLEKGKTETLTATVQPTNTDEDKTVTWKSDKESVATVENGTVTAIGKGTATITATASNGAVAECVVTVGIPLKSISFKDGVTSKKLNKGETFDLSVVYNPEDTDADKTITWSSTNTAVATIENGKVTAVSNGEATITAKTVNGKTATCAITVVIPLKSISIKNETAIKCGQTEKLDVTYDPVDTTDDKTIVWSSSDETKATVSTDGTITAKAVGDVVITAKTLDEKTATCNEQYYQFR